MHPSTDINYPHWRTKCTADSEAGGYRGAGGSDQSVAKRVGHVVTPLRAAECKGWENSWENEYFKKESLIICSQQILNY
jgi:hypothetical protein